MITQLKYDIYETNGTDKGFCDFIKSQPDSLIVEAYEKLTVMGCDDKIKMIRLSTELKNRGYKEISKGVWEHKLPPRAKKDNVDGESESPKKEIVRTQYVVPNEKSKSQEKAEQQAVDITQAINNALQVFEIGNAEPVKSNEELKARIVSYLHDCSENAQLPTVEKLFLCIGYTIKTIENWYLGKVGKEKWVDEDTIEIINKGKQVIQAIDSELVQNGKIAEKSYMFRSKNFYDMKDKTDITVAPEKPEIDSTDDLRRSYLKELE